jgi:eukaryotic-like serine/threonine-protein kinase
MDEPVRLGELIAEKYRVDRVLGRGAMGVVVAATHLQLQRLRAIKLMLPHILSSSGAAECFLREAWTTSALESEHVARVLDVGEHNGVPFIVMEYLEGSDVGVILDQRKALPAREAVLYAIQVCDALAEAHALGIVHRDIKPANLFLTWRRDGTASIKILDFGLAKAVAEEPPSEPPSRPNGGMLVGSPYYMSPEQVRAQRDIDARSDIWAVGVLLYRMLTSQLPFRPPNRHGVLPLLAAITETAPPAPRELVASLPPALEAVILRCLAKEREHRYQDVAELAVALVPFAPVDATLLVARIRRILGSTCRLSADTAMLRRSRVSDMPLAAPPSSRGVESAALSCADATVRTGGVVVKGPGTLTSAAWNGAEVLELPRPVSHGRRPRALVAASAAALLGLVAMGSGAGGQHRAQASAGVLLRTGVAQAAEAAVARAQRAAGIDARPDVAVSPSAYTSAAESVKALP